MSEIWLPIPGYEGRYLVSDLGRVKAINFRRQGKPGLLSLSSINKDGYFKITLSKGSRETVKSFLVHHLVLLAFVGPRPKKLDTNHLSGVKADNRLINLEYCTSSENRLHAYRIGIQVAAHGETHCRAKLKTSQVIEIKKKLATGYATQNDIAKEYGVTQGTVWQIASGKNWRHVNV